MLAVYGGPFLRWIYGRFASYEPLLGLEGKMDKGYDIQLNKEAYLTKLRLTA